MVLKYEYKKDIDNAKRVIKYLKQIKTHSKNVILFVRTKCVNVNAIKNI